MRARARVCVLCLVLCGAAIHACQVFTDGLCLPFTTPLGVLYDELKYYDMYL